MNGNKQSGFTLIELLITLLLISLTVTLMASSFALGLKLWSNTAKKVEVYQRVRVCLDMMSSRISNAVLFPLNKNLAFCGDRDSLSFTTTSSTLEGITKVNFGLKKEEVLPEELPSEKSERIFLDKGVESIEFMYYDANEGEWKEEWDSVRLSRLPLAVKISITFSSTNDEVEKITLPEVIVMLPAGKKPIEKVESKE